MTDAERRGNTQPGKERPFFSRRRVLTSVSALVCAATVAGCGGNDQPKVESDALVPLYCYGLAAVPIDTNDGNPENDTVSGIVAATTRLPERSIASYLDVMPHAQVSLAAAGGEAFPADQLPEAYRDGDTVFTPETCITQRPEDTLE